MQAFKKLLLDLLTSKKALAAIAGLVISTLGKWGLDLPEDTVNQLIATIVAYIVGQGIADAGKNIPMLKE